MPEFNRRKDGERAKVTTATLRPANMVLCAACLAVFLEVAPDDISRVFLLIGDALPNQV